MSETRGRCTSHPNAPIVAHVNGPAVDTVVLDEYAPCGERDPVTGTACYWREGHGEYAPPVMIGDVRPGGVFAHSWAVPPGKKGRLFESRAWIGEPGLS